MKNMKHKIWPVLSKSVVTATLAAGVLAIANFESIWQEYHSKELQEHNRFVAAGKEKPKHVKLDVTSATKTNYKPLQSALSQSLEDDELQDSNPFAHLSTLEPLQKIMLKGVAHFHRETFRSPEYNEESGYDMLSYDVEHTDGTKSGILAYIEKVEGSTAGARNVFVTFMVADGSKSNLFFFRSGELIEQSQLSSQEVQTMVAHRLSQGIPFLSVSR